MRKKITKILAVILTLIICLNSAAVFSTAAGGTEDKMTIQAADVTASAGENINVTISISNNPGIASLKINVEYDDKFLTLTDVNLSSAFGAYVTAPEPYKNPQIISMISPLSDVTANGEFAVLTFTVSANASEGYSADIHITYDEDDIFNSNFEKVPVTSVDGCINIDKSSGGEESGGDEYDDDGSLTLRAVPVTGVPGQTVVVPVDLLNNPGLASIKVSVSYDEYLTLTNVEFSKDFGAYVTAPTPYVNPQILSMMSPLSDVNISGNFALLTFTISQNAPADYSAPIVLSCDADDIFNSNFNNVPLKTVNGSVTVALPYSLTAKAGKSTVIDNSSKYIYGLDTEINNIKDYIDYSGCEIQFVPTAFGSGTGSKVNVVVNNLIVCTYKVLIYGDVNGDGKADGMDAVIVDCFESGLLTKNDVESIVLEAADSDHDGFIKSQDSELIQNSGVKNNEISQTKH